MRLNNKHWATLKKLIKFDIHYISLDLRHFEKVKDHEECIKLENQLDSLNQVLSYMTRIEEEEKHLEESGKK